MNSHFDSYVSQLKASGLMQASEAPSHFYQDTTEQTAFVLNLYAEEEQIRVIYGFTSTAAYSRSVLDRHLFTRFGEDDAYITLRHSTVISGDTSAEIAKEQITAFYTQFCSTDKDTLLAISRNRRKAFLQQITSVLKPLGFRKKANSWSKPISSGFDLEFHAQKSDFSDQYYFNISIRCTEVPSRPACYYKRVLDNSEALFDWQLISTEKMQQILSCAVDSMILPILSTNWDGLIWEGYFDPNCHCRRTLCKSCRIFPETEQKPVVSIAVGEIADRPGITNYDRHIPSHRMAFCLANNQYYVLRFGNNIVGILRYSLFWQSVPFLDLLYIDEGWRGKGYGREMMARWEQDMAKLGYRHVLLSTQEDETAKYFYEKLGYRCTGSFLPPEQEAQELMYCKELAQ